MKQIFAGQNNKVIIVFLLSIFIYVLSNSYKVSAANNLFDSRKDNRNFAIKLSKEFKNKAGIIISKNNFDPILPNTLLRILLRVPENYMQNYEYSDNKLVITTTENNNIIDIRDIIKYLAINKSKNSYILYLI